MPVTASVVAVTALEAVDIASVVVATVSVAAAMVAAIITDPGCPKRFDSQHSAQGFLGAVFLFFT